MAIKTVRRKKFKGKGERTKLPEVTLADEPSEAAVELGDYTIWFYGEPGIGKTTLAAQFPDAHFFMWEPGAKSLKVRQRAVASWREWLAYQALLQEDDSIRTSVVDVLELAYKMCFEYMCREVMKIEHPNDENDRGKSWNRISTEFASSMNNLMKIPGKGTVFISHAAMREVKSAIREKYDRICPDMSSSPLNVMQGAIDIIGYMHHDGRERLLQIRPDELIMAKCRPVDRFLWDDGEPMTAVPMGNSAEEAYANLVAAFNNELTRPKVEVKEKKRLLVRKRR